VRYRTPVRGSVPISILINFVIGGVEVAMYCILCM